MAHSEFNFMDKYLSNEDHAQTETLKIQSELDSKVEKLLSSLSQCPHFDSYNEEFLQDELQEFSSTLSGLGTCISDFEQGFQVLNSVVKPKLE